MNITTPSPRIVTRRDALKVGAIGIGALALSSALNLIDVNKGYAYELSSISNSDFLPNNSIILDRENYDLNPILSNIFKAQIIREYGDSYSIHVEDNSSIVSFKYSYIGTYKGKEVGCTFAYSNFIFNYRCNTTVGAGPWHSQNVVPIGTLTGIQHYKQIDYPDQILKGIDSCDVTFKFFYSNTEEPVDLDPGTTYFSITMLDNDAGGYEGVVPGDTCTKVFVADDAFISNGTLQSSVANYSNAFWGTNVVRDLQASGMPQDEIERRTGITMFFEGDHISAKLIDTVGCVYWQALFTPIFNQTPDNPLKSYSIQQ